MRKDPALSALIAANAELDADEVASTYYAMENEPEDQPRPYLQAERRAHEILLAYLQHQDMIDDDGAHGETLEMSMQTLYERMGVVLPRDGDNRQDDFVVLPIEVVLELLADHTLLADIVAHKNGEGRAIDLIARVIQHRVMEDTARRAWLETHYDGGSP